MAETHSKRDRSGRAQRTGGKRRRSPVKGILRDRPERKPILLRNSYAALDNTATLEDKNDHFMVKIQLYGKEEVSINAMIDSGATEDFIDNEVCNKHGIKKSKAKQNRQIYLADGEPSAMGPVTHIAQVPMDIGAHREMATFQVANLGHHEVILGMPGLNKHSPAIDWQEKKITFNNDFCAARCLHSPPVVYPLL